MILILHRCLLWNSNLSVTDGWNLDMIISIVNSLFYRYSSFCTNMRNSINNRINSYSSIETISRHNLTSFINLKNISHHSNTYLRVSETKLFTNQFSVPRSISYASYTKIKKFCSLIYPFKKRKYISII